MKEAKKPEVTEVKEEAAVEEKPKVVEVKEEPIVEKLRLEPEELEEVEELVAIEAEVEKSSEPIAEPIEKETIEEAVEVKEEKVSEEEKEEMVEEEVPLEEPEPAPKGPPIPSSLPYGVQGRSAQPGAPPHRDGSFFEKEKNGGWWASGRVGTGIPRRGSTHPRRRAGKSGAPA